MQFIRKNGAKHNTPPESARLPGPYLLVDRGLLARWYILHRLEEEMTRAKRYAYPLTLAILEPLVPPAHPSPVAVVAVGAQTAQTVARSTDLIGWLDDRCILIILPHIDEAQAAKTIERWRGEMLTRSWHLGGGVRWRIAAAADARIYASPDAFLEAAHRSVRAA